MKYAVLISVLLLSFSTFAKFNTSKLEFKNCGEYEKTRILEAVERAYEMVPPLMDNIKDAFLNGYPASTTKKLQKSFRRLRCAFHRMTRIHFECDELEDRAIAMTYPVVGRTVWMNNRYLSSPIDSTAGTIIHEASHKCFTNDKFYYWGGQNSLNDYADKDWPNVATVYDTWLEYGFCVPGYTCP